MISAKKLFQIATIYYAACGVTALFTPQVWYFVAGLPPSESNLVLHVVGGLMVGLSFGAWECSKGDVINRPMIMTFIMANLIDFLVVLVAILRASLPMPNGAGFLVVDGVLIWLFSSVLGNSRRAHLT